VVHCALPGASCGQQMISADFQSAPIITGEATLPLRWLRREHLVPPAIPGQQVLYHSALLLPMWIER